MVISSKKKGRETVKYSHPLFSKDSLLTILEESPNMIFINRRGRIVYANKLCTTVTGYSRKEFFSKDFDFFKLIAPESRDLVKKNLKKHMKGEEVPPYEYKLLTRDGRKIIGLHKTKLIDLDGEKAILGIITDITERKKAEEKLEALSRFPEENPHPILRIAKDRTVLYSNEPGLSMLKHFGSEVNKPIEGELKDSIVGAYKSGENRIIEVKYDNKVFLVDIVLGTDLSYVNLYGREITEREKAEGRLRESEKKYSTLVEKASEGVVIIQDGVFKFVNKGIQKILGYSENEMLNKSFIDFVLPDDRKFLTKNYNDRIKGKDVPNNYQIQVRLKDGSINHMEISAAVIEYKGKKADMAFVKDITERKNAEKKIHDNIEELERWQKHTVGRELRMVELKDEIKELKEKLG
jgi:PAS domain S-box-containing protein